MTASTPDANDADRTREQLAQELNDLRQQLADLQARLTLQQSLSAGLDSPMAKRETSAALSSIAEIATCQDREMRIVWANEVATEYAGLALEEIVGRRCHEVWHGRDEPCENCPVVAALEIGLSQEAEMDTPDGREWLVRAYPITDADGSVERVVELALDITERKQTQKALRRERNLLRTLIDSMPDNIYAKDPQGRFLLNNTTSMRLLGATSQQELLGKTDFDFMPADRAARYLAIEQEFLRSGQPIVEREVLYPERTERQWISTTRVPLRNGNGEVFGYVGVGRDISRQMQMQEALLKASRMEAAATLAGGIAQNVNNLMTAVLGYAELLQMDLMDRPDALDVLETISTSARQASELAQQMLAYAQIGRYYPQAMNLNDTVKDVLQAQRTIPSTIDVQLYLDTELWDIAGDKAQIGQAVFNLFANALEAIEDSGRITISSRNVILRQENAAELASGPYVCLAVQDTGCGMNAEVRERIFEPFFTTKFPGRGMGLAAAYGTVHHHGGHIAVQSQEGHGSTFTLHLPAVQADATAAAATTALPPEHAIEPESGPVTVLVIEDDESVLRVTQRMVEQLGYQVLVAHSGERAIEIVRALASQIDLIMLDLDLPGTDSPETLSFLTQTHPHIPVILYSGYEPDAAVQPLLDAGARAFVQMPFGMDVIEAVLREALEASDAHYAAPRG